MTKCYAVADSFRESFPEAYFFTRYALDRVSENRDDGSALFLLQNGMRMMNAARTLCLTRVRMRNVMEVCFGNTEGMTQRERWEHTIGIYPRLKNYGFSIDGSEEQSVSEHKIKSLMELYIFVSDISFDPRHHFETMQFIDLREKNPQWRIITAKEQEIDAKQGKVSLREKYKK